MTGKVFEVTQDIIDTFAHDGAVMLDQPFAPDQIDAVAAAYAEIEAMDARGEYKGSIFRQDGRLEITGGVGFHPVIRDFVLGSQAAEICARVQGSKTNRLYTGLDVVFGKEGEAQGAQTAATSFHIDGSAWGFHGAMVPSFWLALNDVGMDFGPLVAAAGSHKKMDRLFVPTPNDPSEPIPEGYAPYSEMEGFLAEHRFEMKVFPAKRGDVVMLSPHVIHGSLPMRKAGKRLALSTRWLGDDARWAVNPLTARSERMVGDPRDGDRPQDDKFPIVWEDGRGNLSHLPGVREAHVLTEPGPKMFYKEHGRLETQDYVAV